jgi:hypothetical protein
MQFLMSSFHNPPTRFTVTYVYVYLHYMDMRPVAARNTAKNRLEISCATVDYTFPLFCLPKLWHDT